MSREKDCGISSSAPFRSYAMDEGRSTTPRLERNLLLSPRGKCTGDKHTAPKSKLLGEVAEEEIRSLRENQTQELIPRDGVPRSTRILGSRLIVRHRSLLKEQTRGSSSE